MTHTHAHHAGAPCRGPAISRRATLAGFGAALALGGGLGKARAATAGTPRLLVLNIVGGLDGLSAVVPYGDPNLAGLRKALVPPAIGKPGGMFDLGGYFGLNPALQNLYKFYTAGQMLAVHAVGNIVDVRSHFVGQATLGFGGVDLTTGWVNRLAAMVTGGGLVETAVGLGPSNPTALYGATPVGSFAPSNFTVTPDTLAALIETLGASDPLIGAPTQWGFSDRAKFRSWLTGNPGNSMLQSQLYEAGAFLAAAGGPAICMVTTPSADTHANQIASLAELLPDIDTGLGLFAAATGAAWSDTVVVTMTEFGRTAYVNGSGGTDHGTGFAMFLAGGAVQGGRVLGSWPGLSSTQLYQDRDLAATTDIRAVLMGVLQQHFGLSATQLAAVFPGATGISPMSGLVS